MICQVCKTVSRFGSIFLIYNQLDCGLYSCSVHTRTGLSWRWSMSSLFTCSSTYRFIHQKEILSSDYKFLWGMHVPTKVRIFIWLIQDKKFLTDQEVILSRGCSIQQGCQFCDSISMETRDHIMWKCSYAIRFCQGLFAHYNIHYHSEGNIRGNWFGQLVRELYGVRGIECSSPIFRNWCIHLLMIQCLTFISSFREDSYRSGGIVRHGGFYYALLAAIWAS